MEEEWIDYNYNKNLKIRIFSNLNSVEIQIYVVVSIFIPAAGAWWRSVVENELSNFFASNALNFYRPMNSLTLFFKNWKSKTL